MPRGGDIQCDLGVGVGVRQCEERVQRNFATVKKRDLSLSRGSSVGAGGLTSEWFLHTLTPHSSLPASYRFLSPDGLPAPLEWWPP